MKWHQELYHVVSIVRQAGQIVLDMYQQQDVKTWLKPDQSPVTQADMASHDYLIQELAQLTPSIPIISEEDTLNVEPADCYWLIDPLDGTKDFIQRTGHFAISVALIDQHRPVLGVIYVPVTQDCYYALEGLGAYKDIQNQAQSPIAACALGTQDKLRLAISPRESSERYLAKLNPYFQYTFIKKGSCSLKCSLVADNLADIYIRKGGTGLWDTAAAQCILEQMGGAILSWNLEPLSYDVNQGLVNPDFIAVCSTNFDWAHVLHSKKHESK
tara:strand:+ start:10348 stop:11160 length:813 start_codon:yes stop_codon:yes gene_type:complete